jgi:DNA-binding NarL/FixJ family response regulator
MVVAEAQDGRDTVGQWERHHPDVTLVDLRMPVLNGIGTIEQIRKLDPAARVVLLTTFDDQEDIYRGIRAGAKGNLLKDTPREEILNCIRKVHAGETYLPLSLAAKLAERVSCIDPTERKMAVLRALAKGQSNGITPLSGRRRNQAIVKASVTISVVMRSLSDQPITSRLNRSRTQSIVTGK